MKIRGTVVYQNIEGGFWGIEGDDGQQYHPVDELPSEMRSAGARVEADVEPANVVSLTMWGRNVRVKSIKPI